MGYFTFQALLIPHTGSPILITRIVNGALARATPTIPAVITIGDSEDPVLVLTKELSEALVTNLGIETEARAVPQMSCVISKGKAISRSRIGTAPAKSGEGSRHQS